MKGTFTDMSSLIYTIAQWSGALTDV